MAAGGHLEFWLNLPLPRCLPRLILKLRDPITHFKRESLYNSNCKQDHVLGPVLSYCGTIKQIIFYYKSYLTNKPSEGTAPPKDEIFVLYATFHLSKKTVYLGNNLFW